MSTNYYNTLIQISEDSPTSTSVTPDLTKQSVATSQFTLINNHPYTYTSDDVIFNRVAQVQGIATEDIDTAKNRYFQTGRACLRTSPLAKTHGWGIHADADGKLALIAAESEEYRRLMEDTTVTKVRAMRRTKR